MAEQISDQDPGIEVTAKDLKTGETQTTVVKDDYVLITAGTCYLHHLNDFPRAGTRVLTVKGRNGRSADRG
ncbi:hypothetical protein GCM10009613_60850 [Pseudonocardia kongjuensis]|uniref:Uncharacterized protein n=1 Tax=Pseudonocardia kongjuensis TaxID=102227 RepID=A0ABN1YBK4_9PSEU